VARSAGGARGRLGLFGGRGRLGLRDRDDQLAVLYRSTVQVAVGAVLEALGDDLGAAARAAAAAFRAA
jgi:hypothetical protein